jgi:isocitrate lyase
MDCPWCGCGWLFICGSCRKVFSFAEAFETSESWAQIAERVMPRYGERKPTKAEVNDWIESMETLLQEVTVGQTYLYLDGWVISTDSDGVHLDGWHSSHDLDAVPHLAALAGTKAVDDVLGSIDYWKSTKVAEEEEG